MLSEGGQRNQPVEKKLDLSILSRDAVEVTQAFEQIETRSCLSKVAAIYSHSAVRMSAPHNQ